MIFVGAVGPRQGAGSHCGRRAAEPIAMAFIVPNTNDRAEAATDTLRAMVVRPGAFYGAAMVATSSSRRPTVSSASPVTAASLAARPRSRPRGSVREAGGEQDASGIYHANDEGDDASTISPRRFRLLPVRPTCGTSDRGGAQQDGPYADALALDQVVRAQGRVRSVTPTRIPFPGMLRCSQSGVRLRLSPN